MMDIETSYKILKLPPTATLGDVRAAYKDLVKQWHPDRYTYNAQLRAVTEKQLQEINLAYETLVHHLSPASPQSTFVRELRAGLGRIPGHLKNAGSAVAGLVRGLLARLDLKAILGDLFDDRPASGRGRNQEPPKAASPPPKSPGAPPAFKDIFKQVVDESDPSPRPTPPPEKD